MHVQVSNFLAAVAPSVDHDAEAVLGSLLAGKTRRKRKHFTQKRGVARIGMRERCKVLLRDDEKVNGRLRVDVLKGEDFIVFIDLGRRDLSLGDFAENAVVILHVRAY